jgi:Tfp pilus assembly protein PilN
MNAVNLLPPKHRPRTPTGGQQGSAYVVVGVLAGLLVLVLFYVLTVNGINSRKSEVARAKGETVQAQARAASLSGYGDFSKVKQERVSSVKQLAQGRIDWERLARGLARVLPENVWLLTANASSTGQPSSGGSSSGASTPPSPSPSPSPSGSSSATAATGPKVEVTGCAPGHAEVAVTLVRLRELSGATDVTLNEISRPEKTAGSSVAGGGTDSSECGQTHGNVNAKWDATITFAQNPGASQGAGKVPNSLGGGA